MTTLQAVFTQVAQRATKARDHNRIPAHARTALGFALLAVLLFAALALRALVYVHLS